MTYRKSIDCAASWIILNRLKSFGSTQFNCLTLAWQINFDPKPTDSRIVDPVKRMRREAGKSGVWNHDVSKKIELLFDVIWVSLECFPRCCYFGILLSFGTVFHVFLIWNVCHPVLWTLWNLAATRSKALWSLSVPPLPPTHAAQSLGRVLIDTLFSSDPWWWNGRRCSHSLTVWLVVFFFAIKIRIWSHSEDENNAIKCTATAELKTYNERILKVHVQWFDIL